jgi:hypothetical protein
VIRHVSQCTLAISLIALPAIGQQQTRAQPAAPWPSPRARHHIVYDPATEHVLMLGGAQPRGSATDSSLWSWNGSAWQSRSTTLGPRANYAMAFDVRRGRLIVHGGSDRPDETWEWDGRGWSLAGSGGPGARGHHTLVYDPLRTQTVLFGNNDDTPATDTWGWDGRSWKQLATNGPPARGVAAMAFDTRRNVVVLFGGCCTSGFLGDTWEWDGQRWKQIVTPNAPSPRYDSHMSYDPLRSRMVLFGGRARDANVGDTWEYDGRTWTRLDVAGPSPRNGHAMVYDPRAKAILLFGGRDEPTYFDDLWAFDGTWRKISAR